MLLSYGEYRRILYAKLEITWAGCSQTNDGPHGNHTAIGQYIVANRGTVISLAHPITSSHDLATDVRQALGYPTRQYNVDAYKLARALAKVAGNNVVFTGHSLGGGLAALEAYITGDPAVTFDAAGLSAATKAQDQANQSAAVVNVDVNGEFLGQMQGHSLRHDFACALSGGFLNAVQRLETLAVLHGLADLYGLNYAQAMLPSTILPVAAGDQVVVPLTQWSPTATNSESVVTPDVGTCLGQVEREAVDYHAADKVVHALNYELTQLICHGGTP
ncbi:lipase family protein [Acidithiobacillus ferriphilus]|uniref:lipase family protein n=1 Tax=Acidithiobacillus ferriphilus TaxID=1689834 RepID=UPI003F50EF56